MSKTRSDIRREFIRRNGTACNFCGSEQELTIDHIVARSLDGGIGESNWQVLCNKCNNLKSKFEGVLSNSHPKIEVRKYSLLGKKLNKYETSELHILYNYLVNRYSILQRKKKKQAVWESILQVRYELHIRELLEEQV